MNIKILEKIKNINKLEHFIVFVYYLSFVTIFIWIVGCSLKAYLFSLIPAYHFFISDDTLFSYTPHILIFLIFLYVQRNYIKMLDITFKALLIICAILTGFFTSAIDINNIVILTVLQFIVSILFMWWFISYNKDQDRFKVLTERKAFRVLFTFAVICKILCPIFLMQYIGSYIFNILLFIISIFTYITPYYLKILPRTIRQIILSLLVFILPILIFANSVKMLNITLMSLSYACYVYMILVFRALYKSAKSNQEKQRLGILAAVGLVLVQFSTIIYSVWIINRERKLLK